MKSIKDFQLKKDQKEKLVMLTCYDYTFARLLSQTSIDAVLIGDSLGNVIQGHSSTLPVTLEDMIYHTKAVRRALPEHFIITDMPFSSYQSSIETAVLNIAKVVQETNTNAIKIEGASHYHIDLIHHVNKVLGVPIMGHIGLEPQKTLQLDGYPLQANSEEAQELLLKDAHNLKVAGCFSLVLEKVPVSIAEKLTKELPIPIIGIGAGPYTDGQILVLHDTLGLNLDKTPKFVRKFANLGDTVIKAIDQYSNSVRENSFPDLNKESYIVTE